MPGDYPYNPCCCSGTGPIWSTLTIEGVTNGSCSDCDALNGTYILKQVGGGDCLEVASAAGCDIEFILHHPNGVPNNSEIHTTGGIFQIFWEYIRECRDCLGEMIYDNVYVSMDGCSDIPVTLTIRPVVPPPDNVPLDGALPCFNRTPCKESQIPAAPQSRKTPPAFHGDYTTCASCGSPGAASIPGANIVSTCGSGACAVAANPAAGNLTIFLSTPGSGETAVQPALTYNSSYMFPESFSIGFGWTFIGGAVLTNFDANQSIAESYNSDGSVRLYICRNLDTGSYVSVGGHDARLTRNGDATFTEEFKSGLKYQYTSTGILSGVTNFVGQRWTLTYGSGGRLDKILDPYSRRTTFVYPGSTSVRLLAIQDCFNRRTSLTYNATSQLTGVTTPELCQHAFAYSTGYGDARLITAYTTPNGDQYQFGYGDGRLTTFTDPASGTTTYNYIDYQTTTVTDPKGSLSTLKFDLQRNIISITDPLGNVSKTIYKSGKPVALVQPGGARMTAMYAAGTGWQPVTALQTGQGITTFTYSNGQLVTTTDALGRDTNFRLNTAQQVVAIVSSNSSRSTMVYNTAGFPIAGIDANGARTSFVLGGVNETVAVINPLNARTTYTYQLGQRVTVKNPVGAISTTVLDLTNRPIAQVNPLGFRTTNIYGSCSAPIATVQPNGARTTSVYANGRLMATVSPLNLRTSFAYDANRQRIRTQSPMGRISTTVYDAAGRAVASISPNGLRSTTIYDVDSRPTASIAPTSLRSTTIYDTCCSRPKATIAPNGARTSFVYNAVGNQIRTVAPTGAISTTVYDVLNRPLASVDSFGKRTTTVYDPAGRTVASVNALNQRSTTVYNVADQAIASINAQGIRSTQVYDAAGRGVASVNPKGNRWTTVYNIASQSIASVDPLNRRSTMVYNNVGAVTASINAAGSRSTTVYNIAGQTIASVDAKGARSTTTYNNDGQTVASINALGNRTTSVYDTSGRGVASISANGGRATTVYDSFGRAAASVNPLGNRWTTIYNTVGQTVGSKDPLGNRNTSVYDTAGRVAASVNPLGKRTTIVYNTASQNLATIDANGNRVSSVYDVLGRRTVEINGLGNRTTTIYDTVGQTSALVDARANRHSFTYDSTGAQTQLIDSLNRRTTNAYDVAGQQNLRIDARSNRTTFAYSTVGQLAGRKYPDGSRATLSYDTVGNRTAMADSTGRYTNVYDAVGQTTVTASPNSQRQTFSYDTVGQRRSMDSTGAGRFTYQYDAANQISSLLNPYAERTSFAYDDAGRRNVQRNANGTRVSLLYDAASQTTQVFHRTSAGASVLQLDYQYDPAGNRKSMAENATAARTTWTYDKQNQLLGEYRTGTNPYRQTFTYDTGGNRTLKNVDAVRTTYAYDVANQLKYGQAAAGRTSFAYDLTGNQRIEQPPTGNRTTTTWNYENQPTQYLLPAGSSVTMSYNGDNRRVISQQATTTTKFVWDRPIDAYLTELDGTNAVQAVYTNEPQRYGSIMSQRRSSTSHWLHADALGTTRLLTSSMQTTTDTYLLDAWGNPISSSGTTVNPFRWVGRYGYYQDSSTGLVYVRARIYQPTIARWVSVDPARFRDGINYYLYGRTSPVFARDPSGLWVDRQSCVADCEDDCAGRFYPSPWNPWFVGCVAGCGPGCDGKDFSLCSYVNGWPDSYKESLQCACGLLAIGDTLPLAGVPGAVLGGLDCACSVVAAIQESCRGGLEPGVLMGVLAGLDCAVDIIGAGTNDPSVGPTFQAIMDAMILFFQNAHLHDQGQDMDWQACKKVCKRKGLL